MADTKSAAKQGAATRGSTPAAKASPDAGERSGKKPSSSTNKAILAAAAALVSSLSNAPLPSDAVFFGEVSLSGAVRPVAQSAARLKEAHKLGFARAFLPETARGEASADVEIGRAHV